MLRGYLPNDAWVRACLAPLLVFLAASVDRNYLADFWHHLSRGRAIVESGALVDHDLFTFTIPGQTFQDANWLTQVLYYGLFRVGGLDLVQLVNALVLAAMVGLLVYLCWRASGSMGVASAVAIFTFFGMWQVLTIRPQTFSLLLFVLLQIVLEASRARRGWLLLPPAIVALWVNVHGAFPIGLVLIGAYLVATVAEASITARRFVLVPAWPLALCLTASCMATFVTPYGWKVYQFVLLTSTRSTGRRIDEWMPPNVDMLLGQMWVASLVLALVAVALPRRRPSLREVLLLVCILPLAAAAARMVVWWLLVLAPVVAAQVAACLPTRAAVRPSWSAAATLTVLASVALLAAPGAEPYRPLPELTRHATPRLETELDGLARELAAEAKDRRIFARFEWCEYLGWALAPHGTVFMDARMDIFPDEVWAEYTTVTSGQSGWENILNRHRVDALILDPIYHTRTGLLEQVDRSSTWEPVRRTTNAVVYERRKSL